MNAHRPHPLGPLAFAILLLSTSWSSITTIAQNQSPAPADMPAPLSLHPENPRYFLFRGEPTVLVTSGEHYGALLNGDFDFESYFATLATDGLNLTRVFSGAYCEQVGAFNIARNTLAPEEGKLVAPWARTNHGKPGSGYANGGGKFDLHQWNAAYFERLHQLMASASRHGIVVEFVFFCPFYKDDMWLLSPLHPANHIDPLPILENANDVWSLDRSGPYLAVQEKLLEKIVTELNRYDNLYYEVCNEPYIGKLPQDWHDHIAHAIAETENKLPNRHLISWNVANHSKEGATVNGTPDPVYSIFNFHYANPPLEVDLNWRLAKPIGNNETGFDGQENRPYRTEAWEFLLAGGSLFNHLDYSFAAGGHEVGTFAYPAAQPGGGNNTLRKQFAMLKQTIESFDIPSLRPIPVEQLVKSGIPKSARARVLGDGESAWLLYITDTKGAALTLDLVLPAGDCTLTWIDPLRAEEVRSVTVSHDGAAAFSAISPPMAEDLAVKIVRQNK